MRKALIAILIAFSILFVKQLMAQEPPKGVLALQPGGYAFTNQSMDFSGFTDEGITVELWFYLTNIPKDYREDIWLLFSKFGEYSVTIRGKQNLIEHPELDGSVHIRYALHWSNGGSSSTVGIYPNAPPEKRILNRWIHLAYQIKGEKITYDAIFFDGEGITDHPSNDEFRKTAEPFFVGGKPDYKSIEGWIDEVRISKGWRYTPRELINPKREFQSDEKTIALWHFDEPFGSTIWKDSSGNGHTLFAGGTLSVDNKSESATTWGDLKK